MNKELNYFGPPYAARFKKGSELDRDYDTSQLRGETFRYQPHKDYLGHVFRYGFVGRFVDRQMRMLDVGCGQDVPLCMSLGGSNPNTVPELYVGVDANVDVALPNRKWADVYAGCTVEDLAGTLGIMYGDFNLIASLEVYEHVAPQLALTHLGVLKELLSPSGILILSTPVYCHTFKMARNHVNERTKAEMEDDLHRAGFKIMFQHGTFGNWRDYKKLLTHEELNAAAVQRAFYGDEVMGCYLAPRFPEASRNVVHVCCHAEREHMVECELKESIV